MTKLARQATLSDRIKVTIPEPPEWAHEERRGMIGFLRYGLPWTLAVVGWIVAAALLTYSHGQSDRLRTTRQDMQAQLDTASRALTSAGMVQSYLLVPNVRVLRFQPQGHVSSRSALFLLMAPNYLHGVVVGHRLRPLTHGQAYAVWARNADGHFVPLGALLATGPDGDTIAAVSGKAPLEQYQGIYMTIESNAAVHVPSGPLLFSAAMQ
jgi:hypothetical protein